MMVNLTIVRQYTKHDTIRTGVDRLLNLPAHDVEFIRRVNKITTTGSDHHIQINLADDGLEGDRYLRNGRSQTILIHSRAEFNTGCPADTGRPNRF